MVKYNYHKAPKPVELTTHNGYGEAGVDFVSQKKSVPCQSGCPVATNIPGYIEQIALGNEDAAYAINLEDNILPGVLGRICARPCQSKCRHNWTDINGTVEICHLKRAASDRRKGKVQIPDKWFKETGKKVAIIGGGPAGIAAARELMRYGHQVTIYEKEPQLGGMLVDGIPRFRLPLHVIEEEIGYVTQTGATIKLGESINAQKLSELLEDYDSVVLAVGTVLPNLIQIQGLTKEMTLSGLEFMKKYNHGDIKNLKGDVVIIGGGFTAVDSARACARTARKLLGDRGKVTIVYRRTEKYMGADVKEREELAKENIEIITLASPVAVGLEKGKLTSLMVQKNYLGDRSEGGKAEFIPVEGGTYSISCNHLILAIGQKQDFSILPEGITVAKTYETSHPKLFVAGDFMGGSLDVIHAIGDGKNVAGIIDTYLMGKKRMTTKLKVESAHPNGETGRYRHHDQQPSVPMDLLPVKKRIPKDPEVERGFTEDQTKIHATRCYYCHYKYEIDQDLCIQCNWCIDVSPRQCIQKIGRFETDEENSITKAYTVDDQENTSFVWIDTENCIRCGKCLRVCPVEAIKMYKTTLCHCKIES